MKYLYSIFVVLMAVQSADAQVTITSADMPVAGDTLRYSNASLPDSTISPGDSGANMTWNYPLAPISQAVDTYQLAASVNLSYAITVGLTASGYKVADSLPIPGGFLPISIQQVYTFFESKNAPSRYQAEAFAASISGVPTAKKYSTPDIWYFFPLNYLNQDSSDFELNITIPALGGIKETGYRKTRVDGWGTITTPYYTTPVSCIRVRSEIHQVDSIPLGPITLGFPINTVEYKWLVNVDHYPALWVTSNLLPGGAGETITSVKYRDAWRNIDTAGVNRVANISSDIIDIKAIPNPSVSGLITLEIPAEWKAFTVDVFDMQSKEVGYFKNQRNIDISNLAPGLYLGRISSGSFTGYVRITK